MDPRIEYEQQVLAQKIRQINELLERLSNKKTVITNKVDHKIVKRRQEKINKIKDKLHQPYIGRMDLIDDKGRRVTYYVDELGIGDESGEEIVIDWRTPLGKLFTSYSGGRKKWEGIGEVVGKRRIAITNAQVIRVNDVGNVYTDKTNKDTQHQQSEVEISNDEFLVEVLSEISKDYGLSEIISSMQEEQDQIIRLPLYQQVLVQGAAGSGKSSVALHRISYLLFNYSDQLNPEDILT